MLRRHEKVTNALDQRPKEKKQPAKTTAPGQARVIRRSRFPVDNEELVPEFCDNILITAIDSDTSDIHIEPFRGVARVRFRIDGRLEIKEEYTEYATRNYLGVVTRLKILPIAIFPKNVCLRTERSPSNTAAKISISASMSCPARTVNASSCGY